MPLTISKVLDHGTSNPIVVRLSLQILQILSQCSTTKEVNDAVGDLYLNSLQRKLVRCGEIKERFDKEFAAAVEGYKPPDGPHAAVHLPQILRLEEECHNFLYEAKNFVRDLLKVVNALYGTRFVEASEFSRAKKGSECLIDFAARTFGQNEPRALMLREAVSQIEMIVSFRNAVEHPGGYSGELRIKNFTVEPDGKILEPLWFRESKGAELTPPSAIRVDMETMIHNLLVLGEDVFVSWATENLKMPKFMRVAQIPEEKRDPQNPTRWIVTASPELEAMLAGRKDVH